MPAEERALAASRGSAVRIIEEAIVSGRSGSVVEESGIAFAFAFAFSVGVDMREGVRRGEDIFACLTLCWKCLESWSGEGVDVSDEARKAATFVGGEARVPRPRLWIPWG